MNRQQRRLAAKQQRHNASQRAATERAFNKGERLSKYVLPAEVDGESIKEVIAKNALDNVLTIFKQNPKRKGEITIENGFPLDSSYLTNAIIEADVIDRVSLVFQNIEGEK